MAWKFIRLLNQDTTPEALGILRMARKLIPLLNPASDAGGVGNHRMVWELIPLLNLGYDAGGVGIPGCGIRSFQDREVELDRSL